MALKDSFELYEATGAATSGTTWYAQTFTTGSAYTITDVALKCWRYSSPGDITVSIREVDTETEKPTGADKCSVTVAEGEISSVSPTWYTFTFDESYTLDDATKYAIVWRAPGGDGGNYFAPFGYDSSGYANGDFVSSGDSGSSWSLGENAYNRDMNFRTYGGTPAPGLPTIVSPTPTGVTDITLDETPLEWAAGDPAGDTYEIYFRELGDEWPEEPNGVAQAGVTWAIVFGTLAYGTTYQWRIDATNVYDTTTGTTWSFDTIDYNQIRISYILIGSGSGAGPYDDPAGVEGVDWSYTGLNNMITIRKLVVVANSKVWIEDI